MVGRQCVVTVADTCFRYRFAEEHCPCQYINCTNTCYHLIKAYQSRNLNVTKNLATYFWWLDYSRGYSMLGELEYHKDYLSATHPNLKFAERYYNPIKFYLRHPIRLY